MEVKLIKAVKRHPCLFDRSSTDFRNQYLKEEAWVAAAISTGASVEQCKQRWKSLRDRFVREVVSQQSKPESAAKEKNKWCYFELLSFLTKHVNPRKMKSKDNRASMTSQFPAIHLQQHRATHVEQPIANG
uniref:Transcription factor Adf-1 n=1 Tax=Bactrocera dorsalis TaxID=27457 RepID=A0A034W5S2_BACDO